MKVGEYRAEQSCVLTDVSKLLPVLLDARQQRLQPAGGALAVGVQEGDDLALGGGRAAQPRPDQPGALLHPQHPHRHLQRAHVVLQLLLQEVCVEGEEGGEDVTGRVRTFRGRYAEGEDVVGMLRGG